ncbi:MAG: thioredoxin family protein [Candidatus Micrarchaeota archaeon]|nr:thioredoxin family protein [Candidatus Micrarchaeota archaeon]
MKKTALVVAGLLYLAGNAFGNAGTTRILGKSNNSVSASANFLNQSTPEPIQKTSQVIKNPSYDEFKKFIATHKYVVLKLGAPWCPPCRGFEMLVESTLSKDPRADSLAFVMVDMYWDGRKYNNDIDGKKYFDEYAQGESVPQVSLIINGKADKKGIIGGEHYQTFLGIYPSSIDSETPDSLQPFMFKTSSIIFSLNEISKLLQKMKIVGKMQDGAESFITLAGMNIAVWKGAYDGKPIVFVGNGDYIHHDANWFFSWIKKEIKRRGQ